MAEAELTCSEAGVAGPRVGLVGRLQALEALKLLAGFGEPVSSPSVSPTQAIISA